MFSRKDLKNYATKLYDNFCYLIFPMSWECYALHRTKTKPLDQLSFPFRYHARDIYAFKYTLNFIVARCTYEWRWSSSRGEAPDRLTFYGVKSFFLSRYSSDKQFEIVGSEFHRCRRSCIYEWLGNRSSDFQENVITHITQERVAVVLILVIFHYRNINLIY